jgi:hypothetical protein
MAHREEDRAAVVGTIENGPARRPLLPASKQKMTLQEELEKKSLLSSLEEEKSLSSSHTNTTNVVVARDDDDDEDAASGSDGPKDRINNPSSFDVLFGRGKPYQEHEGNRRLHQCVEYYRPSYCRSQRRDKMVIAQTIVRLIKESSQHPGRFLRRLKGPEEEYWCEVSDTVAREKVSHALRAKPQQPPQEQRRRGGPSSSNNNNNDKPSLSSPPPRPILPASSVVESSSSILRRADVSSSGEVTSAFPLELAHSSPLSTITRTRKEGDTVVTSNGGGGGGGGVVQNSVVTTSGLLFGSAFVPPAAAAAAAPLHSVPTMNYPNPFFWNPGSTTTTTTMGILPWHSTDSLYYARNLPVVPASSSSFLSQIAEHCLLGQDRGLIPNGAPLRLDGMDPFLLEAMIQLGQCRRNGGGGTGMGGGLGRNHP